MCSFLTCFHMASVRRFLSKTNSSSRVSVANISAYADSNSDTRLDEQGGIAEEVDVAVCGRFEETTPEEDGPAAAVTDDGCGADELALIFVGKVKQQ